MDCQTSRELIIDDSKYEAFEQVLDYLDLGGRSPQLRRASPSSEDETTMTKVLDSSSLPQKHTRVLFVRVNRIYCGGVRSSSYSGFGLAEKTWLQLLNVAMIPPNAVELLHDKNGGYWSCFTYCSGNTASIASTNTREHNSCAYHVALRLCKWLGKDHFLYARHDFHTGKNLILVAGSGKTAEITRLQSQYQEASPPHLFSVVCAILTTWNNEIASIGWDLDFATQKLEAETGFSNRLFNHGPLPPEQLSLRKELIATRENLYGACRASEILRDIFKFIENELSKENDDDEIGALSLPPYKAETVLIWKEQLSRQLQQRAVQQDSQQAQLSSLIRRVDAQWQITTALISPHNTGLTIQMARDSRNDSILMRRIAFMTIIFLPPTFLATFFSMSFFHVNEGHLTVSRWIWLYVVCTLPLTVFLGMAYGDVGERWKRLINRWHPKSSSNVQEKGESLG